MPTDVLSFLPVLTEGVDTIRARLDADVNAGLDPSDPAFIDTTVGGYYWDTTQVAVLEFARLYNYLAVEIVAAMNPGTAWGDYLDYAAESIGLTRNAAVQASGVAQFTGTAGTLIPAGTEVGTVVADASTGLTPITFLTQASITLAVSPGPTTLVGTPSGSGGTMLAGTYYYVVTAITPAGETIVSNEILVTTTGSTSSVVLTWSVVAGATGYKVYRSSTIGVETLLSSPGTNTYTDTGAVVPGATLAPTNSAAIVATAVGSAGNVASGAVTQVLSPIASAPSVTNTAATTGGADVESDDHFQSRILQAVGQADGPGNQSDYQRWVLAQFPQVGFVAVTPLWAGAGTVLVIITDPNNAPLSPSIVAAVQAFLDPIAGQGAGQAPIGAVVTVATPTTTTVTVSATITPAAGYSLDGTNGTIALRASIRTAIESYINGLPPNQNVIATKVIGQIVLVPGVADVASLLLNGSSANVTISGNHVASTNDGLITLS